MPSDEELQGRFERIRDELKELDLEETPDIPVLPTRPDIDHAAVDAKLDQIEERARKAKGGYVKAVNKPTTKAVADDNRNARGIAMGMTIAYTIIGFPMIGVAVGWLIDWKLGTPYWKAIGVLGGTTFGIVMAIKMVGENAKRES